MRCLALAAVFTIVAVCAVHAQDPAESRTQAEPFGIALEGFAYPYPVHFLDITQDGESLRMAYMDIAPDGDANGRTVLLLHGRNFPSSYWAGTIKALTEAGYRVVVPDQIGFNKSSKPAFDLHFDDLARNTAALLDRLGIGKVSLIGHSTGGMLAVRFARAFPDRVERIVLDAPIGLEDYRFYVPLFPVDQLTKLEDEVTAESFRKQLLTSYMPTLSPEAVEPYVEARTRVKDSAEYPRWLRAFVNSALMIWREPVVHEIPLLTQPTLIVMGDLDRLAPGRNFAPEELRDRMGQNAKHARELAAKMKDGRAEIFAGVGHLPHLEAPERFYNLVLSFLGEG